MENRKSIEKINETKSRFFGKLSRISKPPAALIRKNESMQVMGIRNERGDVRKRNKHLPWDPTMPCLESDAKETKVHPVQRLLQEQLCCFLKAPSWKQAKCLWREQVRSTRWAPLTGCRPATGRGRLRCTTERNLKTVIPNESSRSRGSTQCKSPLTQN